VRESQGYHILTFTQPNRNGIKPYEDLINTNRVDGFVLSDIVYNDIRIKHLLERKVPSPPMAKLTVRAIFPM